MIPSNVTQVETTQEKTTFRSSIEVPTSFTMERPSLFGSTFSSQPQQQQKSQTTAQSHSKQQQPQQKQQQQYTQLFDDLTTYLEPVNPAIARWESELSENICVVPEPPSHVAKYTSFVVKRLFPSEILRKAILIFDAFDRVDFEVYASNFQIEGTVYHGCLASNFCMSLFKLSQSAGYIIEFLRRSGDHGLFNWFYRHVKQSVNETESLENQRQLASSSQSSSSSSSSSSPSSSSSSPSSPSSISATAENKTRLFAFPFCSQQDGIVLDSQALIPLQSMSESHFVDVARAGMKILATCSSASPNHNVLATLSQFLFQRTTSEDGELARCAAYILANISQTAALCSKLSQKDFLDTVFAVLQQSQDKEMCRQLAQFILNISQHESEVLKTQSYLEVLNKIQGSCSSDARLKSMVDITLARVA